MLYTLAVIIHVLSSIWRHATWVKRTIFFNLWYKAWHVLECQIYQRQLLVPSLEVYSVPLYVKFSFQILFWKLQKVFMTNRTLVTFFLIISYTPWWSLFRSTQIEIYKKFCHFFFYTNCLSIKEKALASLELIPG